VQGISVPPVFLREQTLKPLEIGDELYIEPLDHEVEKDRQFGVEIAFDQPGISDGEPVLKTLQDLTNLVGGIVTAFEPLLP
jgi:hypothetical protein